MRTSEVLSFFILLLIFLRQISAGREDECISFTCGRSVSNFAIRFPFRLKDQQPKNCGYPGFELSCTEKKETVLELPFSGRFFVRSIHYVNQEIQLYDPAGCLPKRLLLNFSLSGSPFNVRYGYENYTFFNCSMFEMSETINCLSISNSGYTVGCMPASYPISYFEPEYCKLLKTASVPMQIFGNYENKDLTLAWDKPRCGKCESQAQQCGFKSNYTGDHDKMRCFGIPRPHKGAWRRNTEISVSIIGFLVFLVATLTIIRTCTQTDKDEKEKQLKIEKFLENYKDLSPTRYSYADIKRMTNKFQRQLGEGGYGSVYEGKLTNGIPVAVKVLKDSQSNGEDFINEVGTIGRIHHKNVVRLLGFCAHGFRRALIYEYMPKESLEKFIFSSGEDKNPFFGWEKLQGISIGIARGIEYLHQGCEQRILHFDIKPHNILLDHKFNPKISDFGLAKLCSKGDSIVSMTATRGTMGYIAPEVFSRNFGNVSTKSDVYSFGMLLLEMVGGRKNIEVKVDKVSQVYFPEWIYSRLEQGDELGIEVETEEDAKIAKKLATAALWCIQWNPVDRPSMKSVIQLLEANSENLIMPPNPFASSTFASTFTAIPGKPQQQIELTVIQEEPE